MSEPTRRQEVPAQTAAAEEFAIRVGVGRKPKAISQDWLTILGWLAALVVFVAMYTLAKLYLKTELKGLVTVVLAAGAAGCMAMVALQSRFAMPDLHPPQIALTLQKGGLGSLEDEVKKTR